MRPIRHAPCYGGDSGRQCVHLHVQAPDEIAADVPTCDAFPDGIPGDVLDGLNDHTKPIDGDRGIRYEPLV